MMDTIQARESASLPTLSPSVPLTADEYPLWTSAPVTAQTAQPKLVSYPAPTWAGDTTPLRDAAQPQPDLGMADGRELRSPGGILKWASGFNAAGNPGAGQPKPKAVSFGANTVVYITPRHMTLESSVSTLDSIPSQPGLDRDGGGGGSGMTQLPSFGHALDESQVFPEDEPRKVILIEATPTQTNAPVDPRLQWRGLGPTIAIDPPTSPRVTTPAQAVDPPKHSAPTANGSLAIGALDGLGGLRLQYSPEAVEGEGTSPDLIVDPRPLGDDASTTSSFLNPTPTPSDNLLKQYIRSTAGILQHVVGNSSRQLGELPTISTDVDRGVDTAGPLAFQPLHSDPNLTPQLSSCHQPRPPFPFLPGGQASLPFPDTVDPNPTPLIQSGIVEAIQLPVANVETEAEKVEEEEGCSSNLAVKGDEAPPVLSFHITSAEGLLMHSPHETPESLTDLNRGVIADGTTSHSRSPFPTSTVGRLDAGKQSGENRKSSSTSPGSGKTPSSVSPRKRRRARSSEIFRDDIALGLVECREPSSPVLKLGPLLDASDTCPQQQDVSNVPADTDHMRFGPLGPQTGPFCALCHKDRIHDLNGHDDPLLHQDGYWVHRCCALWSPEVTADPEAPEQFQHVGDAVLRGREIKCAMCRTPGATLGCVDEACQRSYHFPCAVALTSQSPTSDVEAEQHRTATTSTGTRSSSAGRGPLRMVRKQYYIQCPRHAQH